MALSNIFREPRREIVESAVGIAAPALMIAADFALAFVLEAATGTPWPFGLMVAPALMAAGWLLLVWTHDIGEDICGALERRGVHLRPRDRRR